MKKAKVVIMSCTLVVSIAVGNIQTASAKENKQVKGEKYEYSMDTSDDEWENFDTHQEMLDACQISKESLEEMSTEELIQTVIDYPLAVDVLAYDSLDEGIKAVASQYSGMEELLKRDDAAEKLLDYYKDDEVFKDSSIPENALEQYSKEGTIDIDSDLEKILTKDAKDIIENVTVEGLLSQEEILDQMDGEQLDELSEAAFDTYEAKCDSDLYEGLEGSFYQSLANSGTEDYFDSIECRDNTLTKGVVIGCGTTYVLTPKGTKVSVLTTTYFGDSTSATLDQLVKTSYPNATIVSASTNKYNCHSYAWYNISQTKTTGYWMNDPSAYITDGSYSKVGSSPTANGQKVVWVDSSQTNPIIHSGIVYNYQTKTITSKWGMAACVRHSVNYSPYSGTITYYKKN